MSNTTETTTTTTTTTTVAPSTTTTTETTTIEDTTTLLPTTAEPDPIDEGGFPKEAIIGIAVGAVVLIVVVFLIVFFTRRKCCKGGATSAQRMRSPSASKLKKLHLEVKAKTSVESDGTVLPHPNLTNEASSSHVDNTDVEQGTSTSVENNNGHLRRLSPSELTDPDPRSSPVVRRPLRPDPGPEKAEPKVEIDTKRMSIPDGPAPLPPITRHQDLPPPPKAHGVPGYQKMTGDTSTAAKIESKPSYFASNKVPPVPHHPKPPQSSTPSNVTTDAPKLHPTKGYVNTNKDKNDHNPEILEEGDEGEDYENAWIEKQQNPSNQNMHGGQISRKRTISDDTYTISDDVSSQPSHHAPSPAPKLKQRPPTMDSDMPYYDNISSRNLNLKLEVPVGVPDESAVRSPGYQNIADVTKNTDKKHDYYNFSDNQRSSPSSHRQKRAKKYDNDG